MSNSFSFQPVITIQPVSVQPLPYVSYRPSVPPPLPHLNPHHPQPMQPPPHFGYGKCNFEVNYKFHLTLEFAEVGGAAL